jgi:predicted dehydrogenase
MTPSLTGPFSRRRFVAAASAFVVPTVVPASVFGRPGRPAPADRMNLGFIGMGKQNQHHLNVFGRNAECQIVAVCDVDTTRREDAKKRVTDLYAKEGRSSEGVVQTYVDFLELLARDDIDGVVIATPDHWHAIPVIEACKAKKDIYCEKPLTLNLHEAKVLIDCVRKHERVFQTGSQQRSDEEFRKACSYVRSGRIGKVLEVYADVGGPSRPCDLPEEPMEPGLDWDRWLGPAPMRPYNSVLSPRGVHNNYPNWRAYSEYSGGGMTDWGAHHFDIAQWGLGMDQSGPVEIIPPANPKSGHGVTFVYDNGVKLIHGGPGGACFIGEKGVVLVNRGRLESISGKLFDEPLDPEKDTILPKTKGHQQNWLDCVKSREKPICDVEVGARSVAICHLGNLAYWHGRTLKWDPKAWEFPGDAEANSWRDRERRDPYQLPSI